MKYLHVSTAMIFLAATLTLILYLFGLRYQAYLPTPIFFVSIGVMVLAILYQIFAIEATPYSPLLIVGEIAVLTFSFHMIYQISGYGLYGSDAFIDLATLKGILASGHVGGVPEYREITDFFPMIHILSAQICLISKIEYHEVAKWFPSIFDLAIVPFLYLLMRDLFKQQKIALLSILMFAALQHHVLYSSLFIRETIALVFTVCCLYFYLSAKSSGRPVLYRVISLVFLTGVVFAHHLTSLMLIILLFIHILVTTFTKLPWFRKSYNKGDAAGEEVSLSYFLTAAVITITYWIAHVIYPIEYLVAVLRDLVTINIWGQHTYLESTGISGATLSLPTIRYYALIYGSYFCFLIFGLILLSSMLYKKSTFQIQKITFSLFLFFCAFAAIIFLFLLPRTIIGDRFLMYGWMFAFGPLFVSIFEIKQKSLLRLCMSVAAIFIFINLFTIHPALWNPRNVAAGPMPSREDYAMAQAVDISEGNMLSTSSDVLSIFDVQNVQGRNALNLQGDININNYRWVIVNEKAIIESEGLYNKSVSKAITDMLALDTLLAGTRNKVYASNNLSVFVTK